MKIADVGSFKAAAQLRLIIGDTLKLAESPNAKIVVIGNSNDGMPLILGDIK